MLGANCAIICGVESGANAFIAAGAVVTRDVNPYALMVGVPARQIGWMSAHGDRMPLPLMGKGEWICPQRHDRYSLNDDRLTCLTSPG